MIDRNGIGRAAVIQPQLQGIGGLEKYGVHVIRVLAERMPVDVISQHVVDQQAVERAFEVDLGGVRFVCDPRSKFHEATGNGLELRTSRWKAMQAYAAMTKPYDLVVGQTISLPLRCAAARSILLCHFPVVKEARVKPEIAWQGLRALASSAGREQRDIRGRLASWTHVIANSEFTRGWVKRYWDRDAEVINPPIDVPERPDLTHKKQWIVGAGFFSRPTPVDQDEWSYKRQELLIDSFRRLCEAGLTGWELHLAGHLIPPKDAAFHWMGELRERAGSAPVFFHPDCSHAELSELYRGGSIFWHATGYGVDVESRPERTEHFGMVTAEAMSWGCVPVVIGAGGQPEIVASEEVGFLWHTLGELEARTLHLVRNPALLASMSRAAAARARTFGLERFRQQFEALVDRDPRSLPLRPRAG